MSFFFGGKESAVPVLVKDIERLFRGGRHSDVVADDNDDDEGDEDEDEDDDDDDNDDDDGLVATIVA